MQTVFAAITRFGTNIVATYIVGSEIDSVSHNLAVKTLDKFGGIASPQVTYS
jgi:hypothetical protein